MLLIGPPGSGKTHFVLEALEAALREGRAAQVKLIVPTTSMARHLLHTLARRGLVVPGELVETIADVVRAATPGAQEISAPMESYLLDEAIRRASPAAFSGLEASGGLRRRILESMREFWAVGADNLQLEGLVTGSGQQAFLEVFRRFEELFAEVGLAHRNQRIARAAAALRRGGLGAIEKVYLDGFIRFTKQEQTFVEALAEQSESIVITMPDGLAPYPFQELGSRFLANVYRADPETRIVSADSPRSEVLEIARRILDDGRPFQNFGIVLRSQSRYAPLIEEVFGSLHIPFRMRSDRRLAAHGVVRYLRRWLGAVAEDFPAETTLELVCSPLSPVGNVTDAFDFAVREKLPGRGLELLKEQAAGRYAIREFLDRLPSSDEWRRKPRSGREWARAVRQSCARLLKPPKPVPEIEPDQILAIKTRAWAESQFDAALDAAAELSLRPEEEAMAFRTFVGRLDEVLEATPLAPPDDRREVVHVLSVHEARQWALPVVFVCGLVEGWFPLKHMQDVFFSDLDRERLAGRGIALRTSADRAEDEKFLYRMAATRATEKAVFSYPREDESDRPLLRSFFLDRADTADAATMRVSSAFAGSVPKPSVFRDQALAAVAGSNTRFSPSGLDVFLQCPYQFFAKYTVRLRGRPEAAKFRFGALAAGSIVHEALQQWSREGGSIGEITDRVFARTLKEAHLQRDFRTALMLVNIRADLERFAQEAAASPAQGQAETSIEYTLDTVEPPVAISGRIDRYEIDSAGLCFVIDYKYSSENRVRSLLKGHEEGEQLQLPLYMLGLQQKHQVRPGGMALCGIRGSTSYAGWSVVKGYPHDSVACVTDETLREHMEKARAKSAEIVRKVRGGAIDAAPRDPQFCKKYCDYKAVCRIDWKAVQRIDAAAD